MTVDEIAQRQGWTDDTLLSLIRDWISMTGQDDTLSEHLAHIAEEENEEG